MSKKKTTTTPAPHNTVLRPFLTNPDVARGSPELRLPTEHRQLCGLSTLKLEPATFAEPGLHQYASDTLWSVKTTEGEDDYVYTLIEHQSIENLYMSSRMLRYSIAAMQRHLEQHKTLPLVISVLLYHGEHSPYPCSMNWLDCFEDPAPAVEVYINPFLLVDVTIVNDNEIMSHHRMAALTLLMEYIRHHDAIELLNEPPQVMVRIPDGQVCVLIHYIVNAGDFVSPEFMRAPAGRLSQHEDKLMTITKRLE